MAVPPGRFGYHLGMNRPLGQRGGVPTVAGWRGDIACAGVAGVLAMVGGCSTDLNARATIGATRAIPELTTSEALTDPVAYAARTTRLDRGDWSAVDFRLPVDGTVHGPLLLSMPGFDDDDHRAHGLFPTRESALELGANPHEEAFRGLVEPGRTVVDLVLLPVRAVLQPAWSKRQGPSMYKRWHGGEWLAGPMPATDADPSSVPSKASAAMGDDS